MDISRLPSRNFHVGGSTDFEARFREDEHGTARRTTAGDPPKLFVLLKFSSTFARPGGAKARIQRWPRAKKKPLISGNYFLLQRLRQSHD